MGFRGSRFQPADGKENMLPETRPFKPVASEVLDFGDEGPSACSGSRSGMDSHDSRPTLGGGPFRLFCGFAVSVRVSGFWGSLGREVRLEGFLNRQKWKTKL